MPKLQKPPATVLVVLSALACGGGCGGARESAAARTSVLLVTLDTTRRDALGCYSGRAGITPNLDALARESVVYDWARSVAPITLPSHASMLTGLTPPRHGVRVNALSALPEQATTLAERAREAGYDTAAFVGAIVLSRSFGLDQGFDRYDQPVRALELTTREAERPADEVTDAAAEWLLGRDPARPFLLWVHYFDPHAPYLPGERDALAAEGDPYLGEVAAVDRAFGRLLSTLRQVGADRHTLVVVAADHGESLGEHGEATHATLCYDATLRVPLLLRYPDRFGARERSDEVVSLVDLHPTIVEAMGLAPTPGLDGESLFRRPPREGRGAYFESYYGFVNFGWSPITGWAERERKYLHGSTPELYDPRDGREDEDLLARDPAAAERARVAIAELAARPRLGAGAPVDDDLSRAIAGLGYATGTAPGGAYPEPLEPGDRPSPASRADEVARFERAMVLAAAGAHREALTLYDEVLAGNPDNGLAYEYRAFSRMAEGRLDDARADLERALALGLERAEVLLNLGICLARSGDDAGARARFERVLEIDPDNAAALLDLAKLAERAGAKDEAERLRRRAKELLDG